jgi:cation transport ATPase
MEALVKLVPSEARRVKEGGGAEDVPVADLRKGDRVLVKPAQDGKTAQNLWWAAGYNIVAVPLAAGVLYPVGILLPPAVGALVMSVSTVIVAVNARLLGRVGTGGRGFQ